MAGTALVLVLTDVAGSTRLWADHPAVMLAVMVRHHRIVHDAVEAHGGRRPTDQGEGDAVFAAFTAASDAVEAVLEFQRALEEEPWPEGIVLRDRVGIHAGEVVEQDGNLFGPDVHRAARIRSLGAGGQVLVSEPVRDLVAERLPPGTRLTDLGTHRLRDIDVPESIHQLVGPGMPTAFPPLQSVVGREVVLPTPRSSFVGREQEVAELADAVRAERLVTVTGFGGMGKTRLAIATAAAAAQDDAELGVRFVDLSAVDRPEAIGPALAAALGLDEGIDDPLGSVLRWVRGRRVLLVLDNLEQLMPAAADVVVRLLDVGPDLRVLATSREPLRLLGERVFALAPLATPPESAAQQQAWTPDEVEALTRFGAVRLLVARASAARRGFALTAGTARAVAAICVRLEGSPLALELVAVRLRSQSPVALLPQLDHALSVAGGGIRDLPSRQQTLRATIDWSVRALGDADRVLLWRLSVFPGSFTADAAEQICGGTEESAPDVVARLLELVERSLVRVHVAEGVDGTDRFDLLAPIREFAAERLVEAEPDARSQDRHAEHFARAARLASDATREDRSALATVVDAEWHNIRVAFGHLHDRGRTEEEIAGSPTLGRCLQLLGREGAAVSLLRHAAEHLAPEDGSDAALSVLIHLAEFEFGVDRAASAVPTLLRAYALLGRHGSPALTAHLAIIDVLMQDPCSAGPELFDRAFDHITTTGEDGSLPPRWILTDMWVAAAIVLGDVRAEPLREGLLVSSSGREHLRLRGAFGVNLSWVGRPAEGEQLLVVFADAAARAGAYPVDRILPLMVLADIRIAAGRAAEAASVLDAASVDLAAFDQPFEHAMIRVQRAAIDRVGGDLDGAAARLEALLGSQDAEGVEGATGFARWLLAVVERERGRPLAAAAQLRLARDIAGSSPDEYLRALCLLERAVQEADPSRALEELAAATARPAPEWVHFAVDYDVDTMRRTLEARLGPATP